MKVVCNEVCSAQQSHKLVNIHREIWIICSDTFFWISRNVPPTLCPSPATRHLVNVKVVLVKWFRFPVQVKIELFLTSGHIAHCPFKSSQWILNRHWTLEGDVDRVHGTIFCCYFKFPTVPSVRNKSWFRFRKNESKENTETEPTNDIFHATELKLMSASKISYRFIESVTSTSPDNRQPNECLFTLLLLLSLSYIVIAVMRFVVCTRDVDQYMVAGSWICRAQ